MTIQAWQPCDSRTCHALIRIQMAVIREGLDGNTHHGFWQMRLRWPSGGPGWTRLCLSSPRLIATSPEPVHHQAYLQRRAASLKWKQAWEYGSQLLPDKKSDKTGGNFKSPQDSPMLEKLKFWNVSKVSYFTKFIFKHNFGFFLRANILI